MEADKSQSPLRDESGINFDEGIGGGLLGDAGNTQPIYGNFFDDDEEEDYRINYEDGKNESASEEEEDRITPSNQPLITLEPALGNKEDEQGSM